MRDAYPANLKSHGPAAAGVRAPVMAMAGRFVAALAGRKAGAVSRSGPDGASGPGRFLPPFAGGPARQSKGGAVRAAGTAVALLLVLAGLLAGATGAVAQTATCGSPPAGKFEFWCTTMTVGGTAGTLTGYTPGGSVGSLADDEFTIAGDTSGATYRVSHLYQNSTGAFIFAIRDAVTNAAVDLPGDGNLTLELANKTAPGFWSFDLADDEGTEVGTYAIGTGDLGDKLPSGHESGDTVVVRLLGDPPPDPEIVLEKEGPYFQGEGNSNAIEFRLSAAPAGDVTVTASSYPAGAVTFLTASFTFAPTMSLTFTPTNWNVNQRLEVFAAYDADTERDTATVTLSGAGVVTKTVTVDILDDPYDTYFPSLLPDLLPDSDPLFEVEVDEGVSRRFGVGLYGAPDGVEYTVDVSSDSEKVRVSPASLTFTEAGQVREITVTGVRDPDGTDETATLTLGGGIGLGTNRITVTVRDAPQVTPPALLPDVLVSNLNEARVAGAPVGPNYGGQNRITNAQAFTTGSNEEGYALTGVTAYLQHVDSGARPGVSIYSADASGNPGSSLHELTGPSRVSGYAHHTFTAPAGTTLEKDTKYFVVFEETTNRGYLIAPTTSGRQTGLGGWTIDDNHRSQSLNRSWTTGSNVLGIAVRGSAIAPPSTEPPTLSIADAAGDEGTHIEFVVTLSSPSTETVTVNHAPQDGTGENGAQGGLDFVPADATGTLTFAPGVTEQRISFFVANDDDVEEPDETFTMTLSNPANATLADATATGTIRNRTSPPDLVIRLDPDTLGEGSTFEFLVTADWAHDGTMTVDFATSRGTASAEDFEERRGTLTFPPGTIAQRISVATWRDALAEGDETFTVTLSNPVNAALTFSTSTATATIQDAPSPSDLPFITSVRITSDPNDDGRRGDDHTYVAGDEIEVTATVSREVWVEGQPELTIDVGGTPRIASFESYGRYALNGTHVVFTYTVTEGEADTDGISIAPNQLDLNGGRFVDNRTLRAMRDLSHRAVPAHGGHKVDAVGPFVTAAELLPDGRRILMTFSEPVHDVGIRDFDILGQYGFNPWGAALGDKVRVLSPTSAELTLHYPYAPPGHDITLRTHGFFWDDAGNNNEFRQFKLTNLVEVTRRQSVIEVAITSTPGGDQRYSTGEAIEVTATFASAMTVHGTPRLKVRLGPLPSDQRWANYARGSGTTKLVFRYAMQDSDTKENGLAVYFTDVWVPFNAIDLYGGGEIVDALGNDAILNHGIVQHGVPARALTDFTAALRNVAQMHFSPFTFEVVFSEAIMISRQTMIDHVFTVTNGEVTAARRLDNEHDESDGLLPNREWEITVDSFSDEAVTVVLPETTDCGAAGAVCTADGRPLSVALRAVVPGPASLQTEEAGLAAEFVDMPTEHDGESAFAFKVRFSEAFELSYLTMRDSVLTVTNGRVTGARRLDNPHHEHQGMQPNREWEITVAPDSGAGDVTITLPATADCEAAGAVCTGDGTMLSAAVTATVPRAAVEDTPTEPPASALRASFANVPAEHDGDSAFTFEVRFSEAFKLSYVTMRDSVLTVTNGQVIGARRLDNPHHEHQGMEPNRRWEVRVQPDSVSEAVTIVLPETTDCAATGAVCTGDGTMLSGAVSATVVGAPLALSIADASVREADGATLDFEVTLSQASAKLVIVAWQTSDGTATAGSDYTAGLGTLLFRAGQTSKTVSVAVLDDSVDEGSETMTVTLSNRWAPNVRLADATATGTITNNDPLQKLWLSRFGRTVAIQTVDALEGRFAIGPDASPRMTMTVAGQSVDLSRIGDDEALAETMTGLAQAFGAPGAPAANDNDPFARPGFGEAGNGTGVSAPARPVTGRDLLLGSSFHFTTGEASGLGGAMTGWGKVQSGGSSSALGGGLSFASETATGVLGMDWERDRLLVGLALSRSVEKGSASFAPTGEQYDIEGSLSMVTPYLRVRAGDRLSFWSAVGSGSGSMSLSQGSGWLTADVTMRLAAAGGRAELLRPGADGGLALALKTDAFFVRAESARVSTLGVGNLAAATGDASRLRAVLEGSRAFALSGGGVLAPSLEIGLRHDGGDAETGSGVEFGAGLTWSAPAAGLTSDLRLYGLAAHEAGGYDEWGASGSLRMVPGPSGRGLSLSMTPSWGVQGQTGRLWNAAPGGLAGNGGGEQPGMRFDTELGYGLPLSTGVTGTPYAGFGFGEAGARDYRLGWRLAHARLHALTLGIETARREAANDNGAAGRPEHSVTLRAGLRW